MKTRFTTVDIIVAVKELQQYVGLRVNQVYDVDNKTYLIKLQKPETKLTLLIESGMRIHTTEFDWPKNPAPSGFSMKLRKHINNKRLESVSQLGVDRVVDLQFGSEEAAYHLILEMYDRGNLVLTDHEYKILNILRPRVAGEEKFLVRETYPVELAKQAFSTVAEDDLRAALKKAKDGDALKRVLMPLYEFGPHLLEHMCRKHQLDIAAKLRDFDVEKDFDALYSAFTESLPFVNNLPVKGIIVQKEEIRPNVDGGEETFYSYQEFHPFQYIQYTDKSCVEFPTFNSACDNFFSQLEAQKIELKTIQQEKSALKKLENVKKDHESRIQTLQTQQALDRRKGELIEMNSALVDSATRVIISAIANQIPWDQIKEIIKEATNNGDPVASRIKELKLEMSRMVMLLTDPYAHLDDYYDEDEPAEESSESNELLVEIDLDLSAQANARRYFVQKKQAATKEKKTRESGSTALKSAEKKTKETLKEMATISSINKARKVFWFEKFFWFISSENYLVIGGRDAQQNEIIVKRYMKPVDVYVHADLHGATSVVIKNPSGGPVPPKTLNEAAQFSVCFSAAWDSKVITTAYWVNPDQVSKTAPSGEYLTVGSFMIRGKKNFMPPSHLIMGFGFLFKLEESSVERHKDERRVRLADDAVFVANTAAEDSTSEAMEELEIDQGESSDDDDLAKEEKDLSTIKEEEDDKLEAKELQDDRNEQLTNEAQDEDNSSHNEDDLSNQNSSDDDGDDKTQEEPETIGSAGNDVSEDPKSVESPTEFPDTDVKITYNRLGSIEVKTRTVSQSSAGHDETLLAKPRDKKAGGKGKQPKPQEKQQPNNKDNKPAPENIRGKKGKLKKIKQKYKDQDDEERELKMQLLQGSGKEKKKGKNKKGGGPTEAAAGGKKGGQVKPQQKKKPVEGVEADPEKDEEKVVVNDEIDMIDSLTGIPVAEDELLFAIPVCAPYNTLLNYKYKVKLTPGTGKRGKACKTALAMFMADKATTSREKDLLKSVKDQDLARNLPGKVKLSAPHLHRTKTKK